MSMVDPETTGDGSPQETGAWAHAEELGLDMTLVEINLRLTPAERIRQHARALHLAMRLRQAMEAARDRS